jgi:hypothetical protein
MILGSQGGRIEARRGGFKYQTKKNIGWTIQAEAARKLVDEFA